MATLPGDFEFEVNFGRALDADLGRRNTPGAPGNMSRHGEPESLDRVDQAFVPLIGSDHW